MIVCSNYDTLMAWPQFLSSPRIFFQLRKERCEFTHLKVKESWQNRIAEAVLRPQQEQQQHYTLLPMINFGTLWPLLLVKDPGHLQPVMTHIRTIHPHLNSTHCLLWLKIPFVSSMGSNSMPEKNNLLFFFLSISRKTNSFLTVGQGLHGPSSQNSIPFIMN